jgi:hypothetical protein
MVAVGSGQSFRDRLLTESVARKEEAAELGGRDAALSDLRHKTAKAPWNGAFGSQKPLVGLAV